MAIIRLDDAGGRECLLGFLVLFSMIHGLLDFLLDGLVEVFRRGIGGGGGRCYIHPLHSALPAAFDSMRSNPMLFA